MIHQTALLPGMVLEFQLQCSVAWEICAHSYLIQAVRDELVPGPRQVEELRDG